MTDGVLEALFIQRVTTTLKKPQWKVQRLQLKPCGATFRDWIRLASTLQRHTHLKTLLPRASSPAPQPRVPNCRYVIAAVWNPDFQDGGSISSRSGGWVPSAGEAGAGQTGAIAASECTDDFITPRTLL
ncbi:hypothetical protein ACRRTK_024948 [Alexandromys fortis]